MILAFENFEESIITEANKRKSKIGVKLLNSQISLLLPKWM
jgi:hypothetical protein